MGFIALCGTGLIQCLIDLCSIDLYGEAALCWQICALMITGRGVRVFFLVRLFVSFVCCALAFSDVKQGWKCFRNFASLSVNQVLEVMLKSRADSTATSHMRVIKKFMN